MTSTEENKQIIQSFLQVVWRDQNLAALPDFWTPECINHTMPGPDNIGLDALRVYHEQFFAAFSAFSDMQIEIVQQIAEGDRVVTQMTARGRHVGPFFGLPPTGKSVMQHAIRIDRLQDGKIAEHWSIGDMAGLMEQLQT